MKSESGSDREREIERTQVSEQSIERAVGSGLIQDDLGSLGKVML